MKDWNHAAWKLWFFWWGGGIYFPCKVQPDTEPAAQPGSNWTTGEDIKKWASDLELDNIMGTDCLSPECRTKVPHWRCYWGGRISLHLKVRVVCQGAWSLSLLQEPLRGFVYSVGKSGLQKPSSQQWSLPDADMIYWSATIPEHPGSSDCTHNMLNTVPDTQNVVGKLPFKLTIQVHGVQTLYP